MSQTSTLPSWVPQAESEDDLKRRYAGYLSERPDTDVERMNAAKLIFSRQDQVFLATEVAQQWHLDPIVIKELTRLRHAGHDTNLPNKADIGRRYMNIADDNKISIDNRLKALDRYSELMGFKPVPGGPNIAIGNVDQRRVFVLPAPQKMDDWEKETITQQGLLIEGNVNKRP